MLIHTFWKIVLKLIGLWLLFGCITLIPQFYETIAPTFSSYRVEEMLYVWLIVLVNVFIFFVGLHIFLFKTDWILRILKLDKGFSEDRIDTNIKSTTILKIGVIVIGSLLIIEAIPEFCASLFQFFQQSALFHKYPGSDYLILNFVKLILGYFLLTNFKTLVELIEKKSNDEV